MYIYTCTYFFHKPAPLSVVVAVTDANLVKLSEVVPDVDLELVRLTLLEGRTLRVVAAGCVELDVVRLALASVHHEEHLVAGCHGRVTSCCYCDADVTFCI